MIYGAILAGGVGKRIERHEIPKQFITICGTPIIIMTLREFLKNSRLDKIYVAVHKEWNEYLRELTKEYFSKEEIEKIQIINGGKERLDSFINIMDSIIQEKGIDEKDILICHDSVRPFVREQMINDCIDATLENGLALTVIPTYDTIHLSHDNKFIDSALERNGLYNGQTPSGFNIALLKKGIESFSDEERCKVTGTTQLMLKLGYKIRIVNGHTSNFKITTDMDLDIAERIISSKKTSKKVQLLDCTLRDGGIVVNFDYGIERMQKIKKTLEDSGVEYIECGYIDEKKGCCNGKSCFDNEKSVEKTLLSTGKKEGVTYLGMIDYGTFDVNKLQKRSKDGLDGIRLAFHKEHWEDAIEWGKIILEKGYDLYIQPMVCMRYEDKEYRHMIQVYNEKLADAKGFYIVDSFGQMNGMDLIHKLEIADQYVSPDMKIGLHAHNNRQMAYANALEFINYNAKHDLILDASIMGMGKGAGNLCTELIEADLIKAGMQYNTAPLYESISDYFGKQQMETPWGYSLDYYLASIYSVTPSYIKIFTKDERVTTDILVELLQEIPAEKKAACDRKFAAEYLKKYFEER